MCIRSITSYVQTKGDTPYFTIKYYQITTLMKSQGAGVTVEKNMRVDIFSCDLIPDFSSFLFLSPIIVYAFLCISCADSSSYACLMWVGRNYKMYYDKLTFFSEKIRRNAKLSKAVVDSLYTLEILLLY